MKSAESEGQPEDLQAHRTQHFQDVRTLEVNRDTTLTIEGKVIWLRLSCSSGLL